MSPRRETSTIDEPIVGGPEPDPQETFLFVVLHCDDPLGGGARYGLADIDRVAIGRGDDRIAKRDPDQRRLELYLPSPYVSSRHAELRRSARGWRVYDQGSRNGTYINGERVEEGPLRDGDVLQVGQTLLRLRTYLPAADDLDTAPADRTHPQPTEIGLTTLLPDLAARLARLPSIASSSVPVLLLGESGTGKEVLARVIHELSERSGALVSVNCGSLSETLLESQLFGHRKGAFTGATHDEPGFARAAHQGTLFLDEIGDLPEPAQAAFLRLLQEGEVVPVGSTRPQKVDLRVVAATHRPLEHMAKTGAFRSDLLARLSGYRHELVPLRDRREDLGLLVGTILRRLCRPATEVPRIEPEVGRLLVQYAWPLNIRELEQCLASAVALAQGDMILSAHLPPQIREASPRHRPPPRRQGSQQDLRQTLITLLEQYEGNVTQVARRLGKARNQIHRWLDRYQIEPNAYRKRSPKEG
ncbi:MAG TPA: sigma 54-interacting transcriptional regulator [Polyangia bacterium]|jgi:DNA-binding NtrC family response regulator|nr:sigma 54-interacting transcriptional regulator [Polyangia bacterium]